MVSVVGQYFRVTFHGRSVWRGCARSKFLPSRFHRIICCPVLMIDSWYPVLGFAAVVAASLEDGGGGGWLRE